MHQTAAGLTEHHAWLGDTMPWRTQGLNVSHRASKMYASNLTSAAAAAEWQRTCILPRSIYFWARQCVTVL